MKYSIQPRTWIEVDLGNIADNFHTIRKKVGDRMIMAVLKADAYGLGVCRIAEILEEEGVDRFGVANINEAMKIREFSNIPIHILGGVLESEIDLAIENNIILPINSIYLAEKISSHAKNLRKEAVGHILIDTGMGRLGIPYNDMNILKDIKRILSMPNLYIEGIYTHFASANIPSKPHTRDQIDRFKNILKEFPNTFKIIHSANSDAVNNFPQTYFDMVRTGINLYGVFDLEGRRAYSLKPAVSLKSKVIDIRRLKKGFSIGYGCEYTLKKDSYIATICSGYADGIPLAMSNNGNVLVNEKVFPIRGRIAMDYFMIDLGDDTSVKKEDDVVIIGKSGKYEITVEDIAKIKGTHPYDIICSISSRVKRIYI